MAKAFQKIYTKLEAIPAGADLQSVPYTTH